MHSDNTESIQYYEYRIYQSLWLTDIAHHHLAIGFIFLIAGHMYRTNFGIGHSIKDLLEAHTPPGGRLRRGHKGLYDTINNSIHFQLGLALASLGIITSLVAQHMYSPSENGISRTIANTSDRI
jgi:photosystem I P700 chlorophyll a apoprotein A2